VTAVLSITAVGRRQGKVSEKDLVVRAEKPQYRWFTGKSNPLILIF